MRSLVRNKLVLALTGLALAAAAAAVIAVPPLAQQVHGQAHAALSARGSLDCNGFSPIQQPLRADKACTDFTSYDGARGYDNGHYIGHDEPSAQFFSTTPGSGNNVQWRITLPTERALPATQSFENYIAFWFSMALCDPGSFPQAACTPDSNSNDPNGAGSAFLEMQFYPPGDAPFISQISCDTTHWCASLHINSLECTAGFASCNFNCIEPTNFAFIQMDGVPTGPAGPDNATNASFTPNNETLLMNQGDQLKVTIKDTPDGVRTGIDDMSTGKSGFMVASAANGFQSLNINDCSGTAFSFHPEFSTATFGNFVPWAALQANVGFAIEAGHWTTGINGDGDADDAPCFPTAPAGPFTGSILAGCLNLAQGGDIDFDGGSYLVDWPDGTANNATSLLIRSANGNSLGPASATSPAGMAYNNTYPQMLFETDIAASESSCDFSNGNGCVVPTASPINAAFYPFYALQSAHGNGGGQCALSFGNDIAGATQNDFGGTGQYGTPNLAWFAGTLSGGVRANPCP
jgi:hypothetical protein